MWRSLAPVFRTKREKFVVLALTEMKPGLLDTKGEVTPPPPSPEDTCEANVISPVRELFNKNYQLKDIESFGKTQHACGKTYFLENQMLKKRDAILRCESLGKQLVSFETKEEIFCVSQIYFKDLLTSTKLWTSGSRSGCHSNFRWCAGEQWPISSNLLEDGDGTCVAVVVELESNWWLQPVSCDLKQINAFMKDLKRSKVNFSAIHDICYI
ncbi:hypothetical protein B566_EDAN007668 [Ephemera danica]|nr:hypothetical protein B566_EDAN007668 [Ephemera danica]